MKFDKSNTRFPVKNELIYLAHGGISPLYSAAAQKAIELLTDQQYYGGQHFMKHYPVELEQLKVNAGALMKTWPGNIAAVKNTSEALSMVANGYPFEAGDEILSFVHEYPANHYPWRLQESRGVQLKLVPNIPGRPDIDPNLVGSWSMDALEALITPRTRIIAISHVQFTSGYAANLKQLGELCRDRGIDFIVDVAQSLGAMPVYPEEWNISALATAGWKWLLGPFGIGIFYTSEAFRQKLAITAIGAETMVQGMDYLDHTWNPHPTAKRFEYSSSPISLVGALATCLREVHTQYAPEDMLQEILHLQDVLLGKLDNPAFKPLRFDRENRSGILSLVCADPGLAAKELSKRGIVCTPRGGLLRIAPHFYNTDEEMIRVAEALNGMEM